MQQKILEFSVNDQKIRAPHLTVVADSRDYLIARFTFNETWRGLTKTAIFQGADGQAYYMLLEEDCCRVPEEVIQPTRFLVSVFAGDRITTDRAMVEVEASGFTPNGIDPPTPTPDVYNQLLDSVALDRQIAESAAKTAAEKAEECVNATATAELLLERAERTDVLAEMAEAYAHNASDFASEACGAAETATRAAETASTAAAEAADALSAAKNEWVLLRDITIAETTASYTEKLSQNACKELYFEGVVYTADKSTLKQAFSIGLQLEKIFWNGTGAFGNTNFPETYVRGHVFLSPSGTVICDASVSLFGFSMDSNGSSFTATGRFTEDALSGHTSINSLYFKVAGGFAAGTSFKIWGR